MSSTPSPVLSGPVPGTTASAAGFWTAMLSSHPAYVAQRNAISRVWHKAESDFVMNAWIEKTDPVRTIYVSFEADEPEDNGLFASKSMDDPQANRFKHTFEAWEVKQSLPAPPPVLGLPPVVVSVDHVAPTPRPWPPARDENAKLFEWPSALNVAPQASNSPIQLMDIIHTYCDPNENYGWDGKWHDGGREVFYNQVWGLVAVRLAQDNKQGVLFLNVECENKTRILTRQPIVCTPEIVETCKDLIVWFTPENRQAIRQVIETWRGGWSYTVLTHVLEWIDAGNTVRCG